MALSKKHKQEIEALVEQMAEYEALVEQMAEYEPFHETAHEGRKDIHPPPEGWGLCDYIAKFQELVQRIVEETE